MTREFPTMMTLVSVSSCMKPLYVPRSFILVSESLSRPHARHRASVWFAKSARIAPMTWKEGSVAICGFHLASAAAAGMPAGLACPPTPHAGRP